ncbi:procollagen-lysine,2-oxoglutarate 5-dioxygenase 1-like [Lytechinus pictus]|uniref:procollagen-lysine,2-oxoglutarate 5-dioxygenase 1-like n=1 Tax=Lytechinus pictus TaxID=7653 RepID=UPI0030B9C12A
MARTCHVALTSAVIFITLLSFVSIAFSQSEGEGKYGKLLVVTIATEETDGFRRYMDSAEAFGLNVKVVGMNQEWKGGDIEHSPGGGFKINLLKEALAQYEDNEELVIMFTDSYDVIFLADADEILRKFKAFQVNLLFSAETYIWPDQSLADEYPPVENGYPYLCSGIYMGYASYIYKALTYKPVEDLDDDQLFFTHLFLDYRESWNIKLDNPAVIFQNINGARGDIKLRFEGKNNLLHNTKYNTVPCVLHGNGQSKIYLNHLANYLPNKWTFDGGCQNCDLERFNLQGLQVEEYPTVVIAVFIGVPTPFFEEFLDRLAKLNYPKNKIDIFIHNRAMFHYHMLEKFRAEKGPLYNNIKIILPAESLSDAEGRNRGVDYGISKECQYYFSVDSDVQLTNPDVLRLLMETNKGIVAPLVSKPGKLWSNFWGDLNNMGYYARSDDYVDLVRGDRRGIWNVPYINNIYLVKGELLQKHHPNFKGEEDLDTDMALGIDLRSKGVFMYLVNMAEEYGHIITLDNYETTHLHNDMWEIWNNKEDWEAKYLSPEYFVVREMDRMNMTMPCTDVYTFPLMSRTWARELIEEMENFGQWSGGSNQDKRLAGGYENVPTRDIHMNQIGFEQHWLYFLREYVVPICENVYPGYYSKAYAIMNFVVRYKPEEQPFLRPHHDSSTYTINVALNERGKDFEVSLFFNPETATPYRFLRPFCGLKFFLPCC